MDELLAEFGRSSHLPFPVIASRLLLAAVLGAVVGFERESHERPAGLRTHMLVCLAAATAAVLTIEITHMADFGRESVRVDPVRLIEAVTGGVAFLAAGFIIFTRGEVRGLTTAAGLWLAGAIGLAAGLGFWQVAAMATLLALVVLGLLRLIERRVSPKADGGRPPDEETRKTRPR